MHPSARHGPGATVGGASVTGPAVIRLVGADAVFVAEVARLGADGWLSATGRWRRRLGPNYANLRFGEPRSYSWPTHAVAEIRWLQVTACDERSAA